MDKVEKFNAILKYTFETHQGYSENIKYSIPEFEHLDLASIDFMIEEMHSIASKFLSLRTFRGRPWIVPNNYTEYFINNGGFNGLIDKYSRIEKKDNLPKDLQLSLLNSFHPELLSKVFKLYVDGHYYQAILTGCIALSNYVQEKSGLNFDNTPLMRNAFSVRSPHLKISEDIGEQEGMMHLFEGAMMALRNPKAHRIIEQKDPQRTIEWLGFLSVLFRICDESIKTNEQQN